MSRFPEFELFLFLESVKAELLNPTNFRSISDNLSNLLSVRDSERQTLSRLKDLDRQVIKIQNKGYKFVVLNKEKYCSKMKEQLQNPFHYEKLDSDPRTDHVCVITQRSKKWLEEGLNY